jgi:hypothetical protein
MSTGTALDLTPFGAVFQGIGLFVLLLAVVALYFAIGLPKSILGKAVSAVLVVAVIGYFPAMSVWEGYKQRQRFKEANAHFQERCKSAGEKVKRVVEDVDGIVWMRWRPEKYSPYDQYTLDDPYGRDCIGEDCIRILLRIERGHELDPAEAKRRSNGYSFVESRDPNDGRLYRYQAIIGPVRKRSEQERQQAMANTGNDPGPEILGAAVIKTPIETLSARYGVTWEDLSTHRDRNRWIAGSSLQIIDLQTNEVIAERIGYMFDSGLGNQSNGRQPWSYATFTACPAFETSPAGSPMLYTRTRKFIWSVLRPYGG